MTAQRIEVEGARTHNLRSVSCGFPHRKLTVVTGLSGSGKSSLAFDTVYAEGQRRYVETLSTYARQFLQQMRKPPVDAVRNLPPSLALRQGHSVGGARSSVGTITEVVEHLQLLFAAAGEVSCVSCGTPVRPNTPSGVAAALAEVAPGERILICAEVRPAGDEGMAILLRQLATEGHRRLLLDGEPVDIDSVDVTRVLDEHRAVVVLDRLRIGDDTQRIVEAIESAFAMGEQAARVVFWDRTGPSGREERIFYAAFRCDACGADNQRPLPALFNTQGNLGACKTCSGFGRTVGIDENRVVPDPRRSLEDDAIACFAVPSARSAATKMIRACIDRGIPIDVPWMSLRPEHRAFVWKGGGTYRGVEGFFEELEEDRYKPHVRIFMARFRGYTRCTSCDGSGLSPAARAVHIGGTTMPELLAMQLDELNRWLAQLTLGSELTRAIDALLRELRHRVEFLVEAGVGYLTLSRPARTLSGGELHRVLLATSVGRQLTDTCYVLDEPTAGLHPRDTDRLFGVVRRLRDGGNTVIVVEHDPDVIRGADWVVEVGPEAGSGGGRIVFEGTVEDLSAQTRTVTGASLGARALPVPRRDLPQDGELVVRGACLNNLRDVTVAFPKRRLTVVSGVSGSGKSSLVGDVLVGRLREARGTRGEIELGPAEVLGDDFAEVVLVDQDSVARSSRSCALTFSGVYSTIRELFAATDTALDHGVTASAFSFNTAGGRCERCEGTGVLNIEMHFLADVELSCDVCEGRRFGPQVLSVTWNGRTIADVFDMTVDEALGFFVDRYAIVRRLEPLQRVGLGYIRLGQPTTQLSGGELQRLKLSSFLAEAATGTVGGRRLFVFDEPTVGLHMRDVDRLIDVLHALRDAGNTVIVVEHNLDLIAAADHVVDLGPGAGPEGGQVVYAGDVAGLMRCQESLTGRYLAASFGGVG